MSVLSREVSLLKCLDKGVGLGHTHKISKASCIIMILIVESLNK